MNFRKTLFLGVVLLTGSISATEYYVDYDRGRNANPGTKEAPFANVRRAVDRAQAGDTIYILPSDQMILGGISVRNKHGETDRPIVIDGMMNTFTGSQALDRKDWKEVSPGLFLRKKKTGAGMVNRYFMWIDGKQIRMGRRSKFRSEQKLKKPEELNDFEWTILNKEDYYLRLPKGKTLKDFAIREPVRISGAAVSGTARNIVIRNMILRDFWNDGLNIHNTAKGIVFENTAALFCGDDGASAHNECETTIRNFVSIGNATGICHIGNAVTQHENVYISGSDSRDLFLLSRENRLRNVFVDGMAPGPLEIRGAKNCPVRGKLENCVFWNRCPGNRIVLDPAIEFHDVRICGYSFSGTLPSGVVERKEPPRAEMEAARKRLFAVFGGRLERELER